MWLVLCRLMPFFSQSVQSPRQVATDYCKRVVKNLRHSILQNKVNDEDDTNGNRRSYISIRFEDDATWRRLPPPPWLPSQLVCFEKGLEKYECETMGLVGLHRPSSLTASHILEGITRPLRACFHPSRKPSRRCTVLDRIYYTGIQFF